MAVELVLPDDFNDYEWEVEAKGVFWEAVVRVAGRQIRVTFYDRVRLAQDVAGDVENGRAFACHHLLVVERLTVENMRSAIESLPLDFFG